MLWWTEAGFEPATFSLQGSRSTIGTTRPRLCGELNPGNRRDGAVCYLYITQAYYILDLCFNINLSILFQSHLVKSIKTCINL